MESLFNAAPATRFRFYFARAGGFPGLLTLLDESRPAQKTAKTPKKRLVKQYDGLRWRAFALNLCARAGPHS
jgi:hypothetical protein